MLRRSISPAVWPGTGHGRMALALLLASAVSGCTTAAPSPQPPATPVALPVPAPPPPAPPPALPPLPPVPAPAAVRPADAVLAYSDQIRAMPPAELVQEISRQGDPGDSPTRLMRQAVALALTRTPINTIRAQSLLQRVTAQQSEEAQALHPLARLLLAQFSENRRVEEQLERQGQQLRDAQRRIDLLNERLEAVRAIERSLPSRPASAPANGQRP